MIDQFTRFLCDKCDKPGFDSWNKAAHDGLNFEGDFPNPMIFGDMCQCCTHPAVVAYSCPGIAPTVIYSIDDTFDYELDAMAKLESDPSCGQPLRPSDERDADWSGGCVAAKEQLQ